ncbi:hypothetical protein Rsub_12178 [Raphidocelis subcapitata]|uniref:Thioredoxin domain-containing protein n=1 Tax=Raphidocelis subcapitata TaxID=307507 RepID=A0A2V0PHU1_9CHLO|nr:hypothetical protein Rsub_12178 [Raphidocelis subcapitata]|eukprot:GBF99374.1 hypothetical protein Rsub_12178 [Raphidocelis subcapitata]
MAAVMKSASRSASFAAAKGTRAAPVVRANTFARSAGRRNAVLVNAAAPLVGNAAPDFKATAVFDQEFVDVSLSQYKGKYVVLFFYPLDFTFVCPTEITAFSDRFAEFKKLGTEVLGVSVDSQFTHLAWIQTDRKAGGLGDLAYPLVADLKKSISESYGVLTELRAQGRGARLQLGALRTRSLQPGRELVARRQGALAHAPWRHRARPQRRLRRARRR